MFLILIERHVLVLEFVIGSWGLNQAVESLLNNNMMANTCIATDKRFSVLEIQFLEKSCAMTGMEESKPNAVKTTKVTRAQFLPVEIFTIRKITMA